MQIQEMKLTAIKPYENNPRKNDPAVEAVAASIKEFGWQQPIVVDRDMVIIAGHTRYKAAKKLKLKVVPVLVAEGLSDEQVKAYRLADNKSGELATWDEAALLEELAQICDIDMTAFGFSELEAGLEEGETDEDDAPEIEEDAIIDSMPGFVYECGKHRVMCGDSTKAEDVARLMAGETADLIVTDPPYNVAYEGKTKDALKIENDSMDDASFRAFLIDAFNAGNESLKPGGAFYIWHADSEGFNFRTACREVGWKVRQCLVWAKNTFVMGRQDYQWKHETCLCGWKDGAGHYFIEDRTKDTLLRVDKPLRSAEHPTMKPVALIQQQVVNSSRIGEVVLDLFGGSGTTMIACENTGRVARLMELDPKYCDVIRRRWAEYTHGEGCDWAALTPAL